MKPRFRARIGVLVPYTNTNLEPDLMLMAPPDLSLHFARIGGYDQDEIPDENQMAGLGTSDLEEPLRLLQGVRPDVVLYGCTSATLSLGPAFDHSLANRIVSLSGARTVTAAGALLHAMRTLKFTRIGFASPYVTSLNDRAIRFLADEGISTVSRADIGATLGNTEQGTLDPEAVFDLGLRADSPDAQAVVLSCTDMRSVEVIGQLEETLRKPVITSNQAMLFRTLQALGGYYPRPEFGCLFERLPA